MGASIHIPNPGNPNNYIWTVRDMAKSGGFTNRKEVHVDSRLVDATKVYWDEEHTTMYVGVPGQGGSTITLTFPAGYVYFYTYIYPKYETIVTPRQVNKVVDYLKPFYEDGIEEKLGGERVMLGGE